MEHEQTAGSGAPAPPSWREPAELDPIGAERFGSDGYPHAAWRRLRREDPVARIEQPGFDPFWAITRHADVVSVSKQSDLFLNAPRMAMFHDSLRPPPEQRGTGPRMLRTLLNMDDPDHRRHRLLVKGCFSPGSLRHLEERVTGIVRGVLDELDASDGESECDFVSAVAARIPLRVIAEILGVPAQDEGLVLELSHQGIGAQDPDFQKQGLSPRQARRDALLRIFDYFTRLAEARRAEPRGDLGSVLANARLDGGHLPPLELLSYFGLIAVAGHETTRNAMSGGLAAFLDHPDEWQKLAARPELGKTSADEIVRFTSPVIQFARTAARTTELHGRRIREGDALVLFYPSANRDEAVFELPDQLRVERAPNPHLGFGIGAHFCLGANLARMELRVLFRELTRRVSELEAAGPREWLASSFVGGLKRLPVRLRLRREGAK